MRKILFILALCSSALAQNLTSVTAANIQKAGLPLATGTLCFTATDSSDSPIGFRIGGGGQEVVAPYCTQVTNGAISGLQVANPANTSPANISYRVEVFDSYARVLKYSGVQFTGATFNLDNYIPSANLPLGSSLNVLSVGSLTVTGGCTGCGGGGGGGYSTIENAATSLTQRAILNWTADVVCSDNAGQSRSDCALAVLGAPGTYTKITTDAKGRVSAGATAKTIDLADFNPGAPSASGKVPIWDQPSQSYIPGDPLVQGVVADGSTTAANPVAIGGYDTAGTPALHRAVALNANPAGTEYGLVTRNIPGGTQAVSGTVTANISGSIANTGFNVNNFPGTQAVSGTVTANAGTGSFTVAQATGSNLHMTCDSGCSSSAGFSDNAAFTTGTTAINPAYVMPFRKSRIEWNPIRPMSNSGMRKPWDEIRRAAEVPWLRIHDLRHTAITRMAEAGVPSAVILSMAGHISQRMQQHYTAVSEQAKRVAVEAAFKRGKYDVVGGRLLPQDASPKRPVVKIARKAKQSAAPETSSEDENVIRTD
jgi:hypothetical protein